MSEDDFIKKILNLVKDQGNTIYRSTLENEFHNSGLGVDLFEKVCRILESKNVDIVNVDIEEDKDAAIDAKYPFDPDAIRFENKNFPIYLLQTRLENNEIELDSSFQRRSGLWTDIQQSRLIESILLRIPLPAFYFDATVDNRWQIIDGLQRITALKRFLITKELALTGLEYYKQLNGSHFKDLTRDYQRRINETTIIAYLILPGTPPNVKYNVFKRVNTGGLFLEPQEIRNALFQGKATRLLGSLSQCEEFLRATCWSVKTFRMLDQEFALRFVAPCFYGIEKYDSNIDSYLNETMSAINSGQIPTDGIEQKFKDVLNVAYSIFGNNCFRKISKVGYRRPINKAVYEVWVKTIFSLEAAERKILTEKKEEVVNKFINLCEQDDFLMLLKASDRNSFMKRYEVVC